MKGEGKINMGNQTNSWLNPSILLASLGIAHFGNFIYLVASNIIVYQMTGSATAVAIFWIIGPITQIITKFWTGSYIDYRSKRKIMMITYILRGFFIFLIPFASHVVYIYIILVFLSIASSFFGPALMTYTTMVVPIKKRKRFNAIRSFTSSSAFIIGPSIGGTLIYLTNVDVTLWVNSLFFVAAALLLFTIPDEEKIDKKSIPPLTVKQVKKDFTVVFNFMRSHSYVALIYLGFTIVMVATFAMDAQEVVFVQQVIGLSEVDYSLLISVTGIGSALGGLILSFLSSHFSLRMMIVVGIVMSSVGYVIYSISWSFLSVAIGFTVLGFFLVFLNAGIITFYQNNVSVDLMGRVTSVFQLVQSAAQALLLLLVGIIADIVSLRVVIVCLAVFMFMLSLIYSVIVLRQKYKPYYKEV